MAQTWLGRVIPMPESFDLSLMIDSVGKGRFSIPFHRSELIGSGITQTQTLQAPSAINRGEAPRRTANGTQTGQSVDSNAQALSSKSQGRGKLVGHLSRP